MIWIYCVAEQYNNPTTVDLDLATDVYCSRVSSGRELKRGEYSGYRQSKLIRLLSSFLLK